MTAGQSATRRGSKRRKRSEFSLARLRRTSGLLKRASARWAARRSGGVSDGRPWADGRAGAAPRMPRERRFALAPPWTALWRGTSSPMLARKQAVGREVRPTDAASGGVWARRGGGHSQR